MSNALKSQGTVIKRGNGASPEVFTAIAEVNNISGPSSSASVIDVTHLSSTAKEKRVGLIDNGQVTLECNLIPSDGPQDGLRDDLTNGTLRNFRVELTDSPQTVASFAAFVTAYAVGGLQVDSKVTLSVTLDISGAVVWS